MDLVKIAKRNALLVNVMSFVTGLSFILPIWFLYSINELGLSHSIATLLFMSIWLVSGLMEIPTGALADRLGRKKISIIGNALLALYPIAYVLELPLPFLFFIAIVSGIGSALQSGALKPIVHKNFEMAGLGETYSNFLSTNVSLEFLARFCGGITGAWLYSIDPRFPFMALAASTVLNVIMAIFIRDGSVESSTHTNRQHIKQTFAVVRQHKLIILLLVIFIGFSLVAEAIWTGYQIFFDDDGRSSIVIGTLFSVIALCSASSAYASRHLNGRIHPARTLQLYGVAILLTAALLLQPNINLRLLAIIPMGLGSGLPLFILYTTTQKLIANKYHSTALSVINFIQYCTYVAGSLLIGVALDIWDVDHVRRLVMFAAIVIFMVVALYIHLQKRTSEVAIELK